jgi:hypothetical protein
MVVAENNDKNKGREGRFTYELGDKRKGGGKNGRVQ